MPQHYSEGTSFSILFPMTTNSHPKYYYSSSSSLSAMDTSSSSVDCTLSLGTPSTRQSDHANTNSNGTSTTSKLPINGYWDFLTNSSKPASRDHLLHARRCANCDTTSTPLWRNGPKGPKSLCNACGIRYKKEERRAAVTSTSSTSSCSSVSQSGLNEKVMSYGYQQAVQQSSWGCYGATGTGVPISMFSGNNDDDDEEDDQGYLSWRLNMVQPSSSSSQFHHVRDNRPCSLFQYQ
ncbi:Zinc finger NHR/GATA-type protein [Dioscorea alata]|uniref:Zinc finger NHR/GATA-type protein n=1 Tax=Dioscorea alata TaxID=55571 RepID=A0ACB7TPX0_DIOAL|nr:Zinc finger NHR/GATA-type protein [Dioscorea alata]